MVSLCSASAAVVLIEDHNVRRARGEGKWEDLEDDVAL